MAALEALEALEEPDAEAAQRAQLLARLDALGNDPVDAGRASRVSVGCGQARGPACAIDAASTMPRRP
jgi:hypothetical protein